MFAEDHAETLKKQREGKYAPQAKCAKFNTTSTLLIVKRDGSSDMDLHIWTQKNAFVQWHHTVRSGPPDLEYPPKNALIGGSGPPALQIGKLKGNKSAVLEDSGSLQHALASGAPAEQSDARKFKK